MSEQDTGEWVPGAQVLLAAYTRDRPALVRFLARRLRCAATADDLAQDLWLKLARVRGPVRNPRAFLFQIAANLARNHTLSERRRAELRQEAHDLLWEDSNTVTPERQTIGAQAVHQVVVAIATLPPRCREVMTLGRVQGLSAREIASRLGISSRAVEKHLALGLEQLSEALERSEKISQAGFGNDPHRLSQD